MSYFKIVRPLPEAAKIRNIIYYLQDIALFITIIRKKQASIVNYYTKPEVGSLVQSKNAQETPNLNMVSGRGKKGISYTGGLSVTKPSMF